MTAGRDGGRVAIWAARLLASFAIVLAAVAVALPLVGGFGYLDKLMATPEVVVAVSFSVTGALLVGSEQARRIGWLLLGIGVTSGVYTCSASYTAFVLRGDETAPLPTGADLALATAWVTNWAWFPSWLLVSTVLPQVVPYGRPLSPRWRIPLLTAAVVCVLGVALIAIEPGPIDLFEAIENPLALPVATPAIDLFGRVLDSLVPLLILVSLVSVAVRVVRADGTERRQVGWFGYAVAMAVVIVFLFPTVWMNAAVLLIPAGLAVAALRYRLYDLDLLVNRTVVIGLLLAGAALMYAALVAWVGSLFGTSDGVVPFAAAFAVALAFHPARVRVQRAVDRLFYGRRGDLFALLQDLDRTLRDADSPREALADAAEVARSGLRLPGVAVVVPLPGGGEVREQAGELAGATTTIPLELHGEQVGELVAASRTARGGQSRLADADLRALGALAGPLAAAAYASRLSGDLAESHRRLLEAREEERRRLRRDLHDGLGPQLAGVVMGLDVVRSSLGRGDTRRAEEVAHAVNDQARHAVDDVRRLVSGLRPPVLDDLGLLAALRSTGPAGVVDGPAVHVEARGDVGQLPAAVEVAAYRIAQEAMTNAVRHSPARRIDVLLETTREAMTVQVRDDGGGIRPDARRGVGLSSMRERAAELGGWCTVVPDGAGTVVTAHLPMLARPGPTPAPSTAAPMADVTDAAADVVGSA